LRTAAEAPTPGGRAVAEARAIPLAELNAELRRELPPMAFGGAIWSESPSSRFVMVNGQVVHEGEVAGPGVVVERIGTKAAVLRWRDMRIEVSF
jgi:general secretion pathway protein B